MSTSGDGFPPEFIRALSLIATAIEDVAEQGRPRPVLVGGAAVELWTSGQYMTGDFDLLTPDTSAIEIALIARGFIKETRRGHLLRGLYHPDFHLGVEFVSGQLFDGRSDPQRNVLMQVRSGLHILVIPPEDVIADRLGQFFADKRSRTDQLALARMVFTLAISLDDTYLLRRVAEEIGESLSLSDLKDLLRHDRDGPA